MVCPYNPAIVEVGKDSKTPAMRLGGRVKLIFNVEDIVYRGSSRIAGYTA